MSTALDVSIVIACYNEEPLLEASVADIVATMDASRYEYELIFIDDASSDRTVEIIKNICDGKSNYRYVCHAKNVGRGGTVAEGIRMAKGRVAGFLDVDLEVPSKHIPELVSAIDSGFCSVATVARSYRLSLRPLALIRTILSRGYRGLVGIILRLPFKDTETGYKFFDRLRILPVLSECQNLGWFWDTEVMALAHKRNLAVREMPGTYQRRTDKTSSVRIVRDTLIYMKELLKFSRRIKAIERLESPPAISVLWSSFQEGGDALTEAFDSVREAISRKVHAAGSKFVAVVEKNILVLATVSVGSVGAFICYHAILISSIRFSMLERLMVLGLFACEVIFANNRIGYVYSFTRSAEFRSARDQYFAKTSPSSVACLIPVCDEPIDVIAETIASVCAMRHDNKKIYILDDSRTAENSGRIDDLAEAFSARVIRREGRRHFKAGNINNALPLLDAAYIAVFDADQRPSVDFLRDLAPILDSDPRLALVQTRQEYENTHSLIAHAAALQNGLFYEHICEGKSAGGAMFCCGTNFVMRLAALKDIGGFDTTSITEDFATTMTLHSRGWKTAYNDKLYATGLGPETLGEYFKQHSRWATGTFQVMRSALKIFVIDRRALSAKQWFDYWLSFSYYLSGPANLYLLLLPSAYILLGIGLIKENGPIYLTFFLAAFISSWVFFMFSLIKRGYPARELIVVCARLETCKFAVYSKALVVAALGLKTTFKVTQKGSQGQLGWFSLGLPLAFFALNAVAAVVGLYRLGVLFNVYLAINTFWAAFNAWQLSAVIQYNSGSVVRKTEYLTPFKDDAAGLSLVAPSGRTEGSR